MLIKVVINTNFITLFYNGNVSVVLTELIISMNARGSGLRPKEASGLPHSAVDIVVIKIYSLVKVIEAEAQQKRLIIAKAVYLNTYGLHMPIFSVPLKKIP